MIDQGQSWSKQGLIRGKLAVAKRFDASLSLQAARTLHGLSLNLMAISEGGCRTCIHSVHLSKRAPFKTLPFRILRFYLVFKTASMMRVETPPHTPKKPALADFDHGHDAGEGTIQDLGYRQDYRRVFKTIGNIALVFAMASFVLLPCIGSTRTCSQLQGHCPAT